MKDIKKHLIFLGLLVGLFLLNKILSMDEFQNSDANKTTINQIQTLSLYIQHLYHSHPILVTSLFCISFIIVTILYIPFTGSIFVLFAGGLFGLMNGILLFSFLVSFSYTISFLISRHIFYDFIQKRIGKVGRKIIAGFEDDGFVYLLSLRLAGVVPAVIVNAAMGVTNVKLWQFYLAAQIGTLPHIVVMIYAGSQILNIKNINSLVPENFLICIFLISIAPVFIKIIAELFVKKKKPAF